MEELVFGRLIFTNCEICPPEIAQVPNEYHWFETKTG